MSDNSSSRFTRRDFLATTGGGFVAAGVGSSASAAVNQNRFPAERPTPENPAVGEPVSDTARAQDGEPRVPGPPLPKLGYAIMGLGKYAVGQILPAFAVAQRSRLAALVSGDRLKAEAIATHYGLDHRNIYNYENFEEIRDNPNVDVVYVITPNALHAEHTIRAAFAGKHVLCEKPMATTIEDCYNMLTATRRTGRQLMIGYRVRYEPYNQTAIQWAREQRYGPAQFIVSDTVLDVGDPNQWRLDRELSGGGSLMDIGIYSVNAARYLTGEEPFAINAFMHRDPDDPRFTDIEQSIVFQFHFPSGAMANCTSSFGTATVNRYRVIGTEGWFELDPATTYTGQRLFHGQGDAVQELKLPHINQFAAQMDHFSEAIQENRRPLTPGEEGLQDVRLMIETYKAAQDALDHPMLV